MTLAILQAGIDRRVHINTVDIDGQFKINAISIDISKIQKVDGTTLYDSFELSCHPVDKTSILKLIMLIYYKLLIIMLWLLMFIIKLRAMYR